MTGTTPCMCIGWCGPLSEDIAMGGVIFEIHMIINDPTGTEYGGEMYVQGEPH